jgi:hypothetical protein
MPRRLVLVGVEAAGFQTGEPLSPGVLDAVTAAAEMIAGLVGAAAGEP